MAKSYKGVRPKKNWVYTVEMLMELYGVSRNTVSNWVIEGLAPSDGQRPYVFQGAEVIRFHSQRLEQRRSPLQAGEFQCRTCQASVFPTSKTVTEFQAANGVKMLAAACPRCTGPVKKIPSETDRDILRSCRNPNTPMDCPHEEGGAKHGGIWISSRIESPKLWLQNDRVLLDWLGYAGRYDDKTTDRHLSAIRYFENLLDGKSFRTLTRRDVIEVRDDLKRRAKDEVSDSLSASSIKHIASHLRIFLDWLSKQEGYRRLPKDLVDNLHFPKAVLASAAQVKQKAYPTISEAQGLLKNMPSKSLADQRARAIFALGFLGALRADTLVSLRVEHFDFERRRIVQNGRVSRAKAGKTFDIVWNPIPRVFEQTVIDWVETLQRFGFRGSDALFPHAKYLKHMPRTRLVDCKPVPVMSTYHVVTQAFKLACQTTEPKYAPHCVKDTIAAERDALPLTRLQRAAMSANMGHASERITEQHYGNMPDEQRIEVMESIGESSIDTLPELSVRDKVALVDEIVAALYRR